MTGKKITDEQLAELIAVAAVLACDARPNELEYRKRGVDALRELRERREAAQYPYAWAAIDSDGDMEFNLQDQFSRGCSNSFPLYREPVDTQREEINSLKSGEPVGYLVGTALLENLTQAAAYRADTGLEIRPLFTCPPALAAWFPAETSPDVPRGEFLDCWVAGHFRECDHAAGPGQYKSARPLVLLARWGGTELLRGDEGGWSVVDMPDGSFEPRAWQPIAKPEFPLGAL
ncbi:hypothetical protein ACSVNO_05965 [Salmonella enterica]|uniref:hypothetical protein n=1 Tax=Salmonella enterica TaxID=28901 RepID=UPI003F31EC01